MHLKTISVGPFSVTVMEYSEDQLIKRKSEFWLMVLGVLIHDWVGLKERQQSRQDV